VLTIRYDRNVKTLVQMMWIPVLITALYIGWVLWQRHTSLTEMAPKPVAEDPLAKYGGDVKIVQFYSGNGAILQGGKAQLCYGVVNAKEVRLDPPVEKVWPSLSRCFDVAPAKTTHYTLTAEGADHKMVTASLDITVQR
jgi:hypothetical protein